jgi:beta-aspartyl-peptidase (threonine type)
MTYKGLSLEAAMRETVMGKLVEMSGEGGMIGVDASGKVSMQFNSDGMYRGFRASDGSGGISIYAD